MDVDETLTELGRFGKFQMRTCFLLLLTSAHLAMHMLALSFHGLEPNHHCRLPNETSYITDDAVLNRSIPWVWDVSKDNWQRSKCERYQHELPGGMNRTETIDCDQGWSFYNPDQGKMTIVEEWSLVCDSKTLVSISQSVLMAGVMAGAFFMAQVADTFGRKPVLLFSLWFQAALDIAIALMPSYIPFTCMVFFIGICQSGLQVASFALSCEYLTVDIRVYGTVIGALMWTVGMLLLDLLAYFIASWRYLQIALAVCNLLTIPYYWLVPESLHWLVTHGKGERAKEIVRKAAKMNGLLNIPNLLSQNELKPLKSIVEDKGTIRSSTKSETLLPNHPNGKRLDTFRNTTEDNDGKKYTLISILCHVTLLIRSSILCIVWFTNGLVYYGLSLFTPSMPGTFYINFMITGLVEIPACVAVAIIVERFGRRRGIIWFSIIAGVSLLLLMFIPRVTDSGTDISKLFTTLCMVGKFGISGSFMTMFIYAAEVYPTVVRSIGMGWNSVFARIGGILAPYAKDLHAISTYFVPIVFGILALLCAALMLFMPETRRSPLPETLGDVTPLSLRELVCGGGEKTEVARKGRDS